MTAVPDMRRGQDRDSAGRLAALAFFGVAVASLLVGVAVSPSRASAAPVYSYFPNSAPADGRMLRIAGQGLQTLSGQTVTVGFSTDKTTTTFNVGFFDGASDTIWDMSTQAFPSRYTLYADPLGDGTGNTVVATWFDTGMAANAWTDFPVTTTAAAKSPSGNYFYKLVVTGTSPALSAGNSFKVRVEGYTFIAPLSVFGFSGAYDQDSIYPNYPTRTPTTYDGTWDFYLYAPQDMTRLDIWDGDLDVAVDTDDPNTGTAIPPFDAGAGQPEGARNGNPADDSGTADYLRPPNVRYDVITPAGTTFSNNDPSGNTEWELFRLDTTTSDPAITDYRPTTLPAGMYRVHITGLDLHNTDAFRFDAPLIGVDGTGRPMIPPAPFLIGDLVFNDANHDGVWQPGETGLPFVVVTLKDRTTGSVLAAATTDLTGNYQFNSWNGTYDIVIDPSNYNLGGALFGYQPTSPGVGGVRVTVNNANLANVDFGAYLPAPTVLTLTPDQTGSMAPGNVIPYTYTLRNGTASGGTFNLTTSSSLGFADQITNAGGTTITSVALAAGESTTVVVKVSVPATATIGMVDSMRLTAAKSGNPAVNASAMGVTTVRAGVSITPDNAGFGGVGATVTYAHTVTNSWPTTRTIALTAVSSRGFAVSFLDSNGVTPVTSVSVGPNGATHDIFVRIVVPAGAAVTPADTTVVTATAPAGGGSDTANDVTTFRRMTTYDTIAYVHPVELFTRGDVVYARATGLNTSYTVFFVWTDSKGAIMRRGPDVAVNAQGVAVDQYTTAGGDATGAWTVAVWRRRNNPVFQTSSPFTVVANAEVSQVLATDAASPGINIAVTSTLANHASAPIINSTATYTIWWDTDGSGTFNTGDTYIDSAGAPRIWNGVTVVSTHVTTGIDVAATSPWTDPPWLINNAQFPNQGNYQVTVKWTDVGGSTIDTKTGQFYSIPAMGWPLFALAAVAGAWWLWRRRDQFAEGPGPAVTG